MWWWGGSVDCWAPPAQGSCANSDWSVVTASWFRLCYGRFGPVIRLRETDVLGCRLFIAGCCTTHEMELPDIAVRPDDVLVAGDLAGQCPVFYGSFNGQVVVGSHAGKLAEFVGRSLNQEWLAARLLLPSVSDVWWTGTPWRGVHAVRPG